MNGNIHTCTSLRNGISNLTVCAAKSPQFLERRGDVICAVIDVGAYKELLYLLASNEIKLPPYFTDSHPQGHY